MASRPEENLYCPICRDVFREPVLLSCSHSFCRACWQQWWPQRANPECPVCKAKSSLYDPPRNLALKNLCEAFRAERNQRGSAAPSDLRLFSPDRQQPVRLTCLHSGTNTNRSFRATDEAAADYKDELLKPLQDKLELFNDIKANFDIIAKDIDVQAQDTERKMKDVFLMLQRFLQEEEQARLGALREEKKLKSQMMARKSEALSREIAALSDTVRDTKEVLGAGGPSFLQRYQIASELVHGFQFSDPQLIAGALIDVDKHLNNLSLAVLGSIKENISTSEPTVNPAPLRYRP